MARSRTQPLYEQLADTLIEQITRECQPGDLLPSERRLSERYCLSRTTVRAALLELEKLGLVVRQHGRGTFVADTATRAANLTQAWSFTEQMRSMGRKPTTTILEFGRVKPDEGIDTELGLLPGEQAIRMYRLRSADSTPMMVETSYLPAGEFPGLSFEEVSSKPLYDIMEQDYHEKILYAEEESYASVARGPEAELLDIAEGAPVLKLVRTTYNDRNRAIEHTLSTARADQFKYKFTHVRS